MADHGFERHMLAYVSPDAWAIMVAQEEDSLLREWAHTGRPAIIRRPDCSDEGDSIPLGVPLPPAHGKRRVALRCPADAIVRTAPPPLLREAAQVAPDAWQISIAQLLLVDRDVACFGSLAWSYLTGLAYLSDSSDLDLIFACDSFDRADSVARGIMDISNSAPMRIDAELVTPQGRAVQWREWASDATTIVAKSMEGATLLDRQAVFA